MVSLINRQILYERIMYFDKVSFHKNNVAKQKINVWIYMIIILMKMIMKICKNHVSQEP